jgi:hypothetical protein
MRKTTDPCCRRFLPEISWNYKRNENKLVIIFLIEIIQELKIIIYNNRILIAKKIVMFSSEAGKSCEKVFVFAFFKP